MGNLTYARVREIFQYDPHTGMLTFACDMPRKGKKGNEAGWIGTGGYRRVQIDYKSYPTHVVIWLWMTGTLPTHDIDHEDRNRTNNIWTNLREGTRSQNLMNQGLKFNNSSGFKGVTSRGGSHAVRFRANGRVIHVGSFPSAREAAEAYDIAVVQHQGSFAKTNKALGLLP